MSHSWFVRYTVKSNGHVVEMFTILGGTSPNQAIQALIDEQMKIHGIVHSDIDILIMTKVA
ncbi:hypothetical protein [Enterobacter soli]|uniref:hypothetical protein n=1 Tax=Enterobacter soli TaxID=885040 RepID=UPI004046F8BC